MSDELRFVNAFIGFCTPMGGTWPGPLVTLSYKVVGIEREIHTSLAGQPCEVVPELICASPAVNHLFCLEAKSATLSLDQARKYLALTQRQLILTGVLPQGTQSAALTHDTIYITLPRNAPTLASAMVVAQLALPIVQGDSLRFELINGTISQMTLHQAFSAGIDIQPHHQWPMGFVKITSHATEGDLAAHIIVSLSDRIMGSTNFTTAEVAKDSISHWEQIGTREKNAFLNKIHRILNRAQMEELKPYFEPDQRPSGIMTRRNRPWKPRGNRPMYPSRMNTLQSDAITFVHRLQAGTPYRSQQRLLPGLTVT